MLLGYAVGPLAMSPPEVRQRWLARLGLGALAAFAVLRGFNVYGNPTPWTPQGDWLRSLGAIFNVVKYPPALAYVLATLGFSLLIWRWFDRDARRALHWLAVFGSVPMFVYLLHVGGDVDLAAAILRRLAAVGALLIRDLVHRAFGARAGGDRGSAQGLDEVGVVDLATALSRDDQARLAPQRVDFGR
jgi:uncharacterized membrane protein